MTPTIRPRRARSLPSPTPSPNAAAAPVRRRRLSVAAAAATALVTLAACGSSSERADDTSARVATSTTAPDVTTEESSTTAAAETSTSASTSTSAAATTSPADELGISSSPSDWTEYLLVRRITEDDGYFGIGEDFTLVEARRYWTRCDDGCGSLMIDARLVDNSGSGLPAREASLIDGVMNWTTVDMLSCLTPAGALDGPVVTEETLTMSLRIVDGSGGAALAGPASKVAVTESEPDACVQGTVGWEADAVLFDPARAPRLDAVEAIFFGDGSAAFEERGIRPCEPEDSTAAGCDAVVRRRFDVPNHPDGAQSRSVDIPVVKGPDGIHYGSADYVAGCDSDVDGSFVTTEGYSVRHEVWASFYDPDGSGGLDPILVEQEKVVGTTLETLPPEQQAVCAPFETDSWFVGSVTQSPTVVDWSAPAFQYGPTPGTETTPKNAIDDAVRTAETLLATAAVSDIETTGLRGGFILLGPVTVVGPNDNAAPGTISAFSAAIDPGIGFAVRDTSGVCSLGWAAPDGDLVRTLQGLGDATNCNAYAALDAFEAGELSPVT